MKKVFLLFMASAVLLSCSKDENGNNDEQGNGCKVVASDFPLQISSDEKNVQHIVFEYDNEGRIILAKAINKSDNSRMEFNYDAREILVKEYSREGELYLEIVYTLDTSGKIISMTSSESVDESVSYKYNDGKLSQIINNETSFTVNFEYDVFDNPIQEWSEPKGRGKISSYTYDLTSSFVPTSVLAETFPYQFDYEESILYMQGYFGKTPKNKLIQDKTDVYLNDKLLGSDTIDYTYITDKDGNVISITKNYETESESVNFKYECK